MANRGLVADQQVLSTGSVYKQDASQLAEDLPLEVMALLDVFARIEARRHAKLREEQKVVS